MSIPSDLKNYTSKVPVEQTIMEIEYILTRAGGIVDIHKLYDGAGNCIGLDFAVRISDEVIIPFRLPMKAQNIQQLIRDMKKEGKLRNLSQRDASDINTARRVGWRILKDWVHAQVAFIEAEQVTIQQVFLPYMYNSQTNETLYDVLTKDNYKLLKDKNE